MTKEKMAEIDHLSKELCKVLNCKPNDILKNFLKLKNEHDRLTNTLKKLQS